MATVFESPDGGNTVYARDTGSVTRRLVSMSDKERVFREKVREDALWDEIRATAKFNTALQEALDRVKVLYYMTLKDNK